MRHIGFTGTRKGMTEEQTERVRMLLEAFQPFIFHHGDCVGADTQAHEFACILASDGHVVVHPPQNKTHRAYCNSSHIMKPRNYLDRNRDIVHASDILIAAPSQAEEIRRSGTWSTVRYAKDVKLVFICTPDGGMEILLPDDYRGDDDYEF